jgi:hypothetical protein
MVTAEPDPDDVPAACRAYALARKPCLRDLIHAFLAVNFYSIVWQISPGYSYLSFITLILDAYNKEGDYFAILKHASHRFARVAYNAVIYQ